MKGFIINLIQGYLVFFLVLTAYSFNDLGGAIIQIPDANFENYLETHNADGEVVSVGDPTSLGDGVLGNGLADNTNYFFVSSLDLQNLDIESLEGIKQFFSLTDLNVSNNPLELLDVSGMGNIVSIIAQNCALKGVNLLFTSSTLSALDLSVNPDLNCIKVDDVSNAQNSSGYNPGTGTYVENTQPFIDLSAQSTSFTYDGTGNESDIDNWLANNGGALASSSCSDILWSWTIDLVQTVQPEFEISKLIYDVTFTAADIFGLEITTNAQITITDIGLFCPPFYGQAGLCDDTFDTNPFLIGFDPALDLNRSNVLSYSFTQLDGPTDADQASFSETVIDFPDDGAGSYFYEFKVDTQKELSTYFPNPDPDLSVTITEVESDTGFITLSEKQIPFYAGEDKTIISCSGDDPLTIEDLTRALDLSPNPYDPDTFPQNGFEPEFYGSDSSGNYLTEPIGP